MAEVDFDFAGRMPPFGLRGGVGFWSVGMFDGFGLCRVFSGRMGL